MLFRSAPQRARASGEALERCALILQVRRVEPTLALLRGVRRNGLHTLGAEVARREGPASLAGHAPTSVAVVTDAPESEWEMRTFQRILVPIDLTEKSLAAVNLAAEFAAEIGRTETRNAEVEAERAQHFALLLGAGADVAADKSVGMFEQFSDSGGLFFHFIGSKFNGRFKHRCEVKVETWHCKDVLDCAASGIS